MGTKSAHFSISDAVMPGPMSAVKGLDKTKGLDLILHTPGGEINATEQIVFYLRNLFKGDVRAIVPHLAMSAGTMIALACKSIVMGLHSNLGPIDPQVGGGPASRAVACIKVPRLRSRSASFRADGLVAVCKSLRLMHK